MRTVENALSDIVTAIEKNDEEAFNQAFGDLERTVRTQKTLLSREKIRSIVGFGPVNVGYPGMVLNSPAKTEYRRRNMIQTRKFSGKNYAVMVETPHDPDSRWVFKTYTSDKETGSQFISE